MKNDRLIGSYRLSVVCCSRNTNGLPFSYLPTLAFALVLTLLLAPPCLSQQRWQRTYGGTSEDYGRSIQQTQDGGYIVTGMTASFGNYYQVYLLKTNAQGDTLWTRTYGGADYDCGCSVQQTQDGGYVVAGWTNSFGNSGQIYLVKTNASGDTLWTRNYGGTGWDQGYSVQQTTDGGYIVAGYTSSFGDSEQVYLIKTNASGDTLWTRNYGGTRPDYGYSVQQTSDGGYIVAGSTTSFGAGSRNVYLIKTNVSGDTNWTRTYGGMAQDEGWSVQQTQDTGYIIAGVTYSFGNSSQVYIVKTNAAGDTLWTKVYGGTSADWGYSVRQTQDGGYVVAGWTDSFGNGSQAYLIRTNAQGDTLWTRTYGGAGGDYSESVRQTQDGGYVVAGYTTSFGNRVQVYLIKTDANGSSGVEETAGVRGQRLEVRIKATPNPFITYATIPGYENKTFEMYDIAGKRVGTYTGDRIGANLPGGVYFLRTSGKTSTPVRIVKVR